MPPFARPLNELFVPSIGQRVVTPHPFGGQGLAASEFGVVPPAAAQIKTYTPTEFIRLGTPANGTEVRLDVGSGIYWILRFDADSDSDYKWEVSRSPMPLTDEVDAEEQAGSTATWVNLATDGPLVVAPLAGDYWVAAKCHIGNNNASIQGSQMGIAKGDTTPTGSFSAVNCAQTNRHTHETHVRLDAVTRGTEIKMRYLVNSNIDQDWSLRSLLVFPIRLGTG